MIGVEEYEDAKATWDDDEVKDPRGLEQREQYPPEKRIAGEHWTVSFKNNWAFGDGEPRDWIKEIQDEINYLRMKEIDIDEVFSVLMKIMKKVKLGVVLIDTELNWRNRLKISSHWWAGGGDCCGSSSILWQENHVVKKFY